MILTSTLVLLSLVGTVQPFQFGNLQLPMGPTFSFDPAASQNLPLFQLNQPQLYSNQDFSRFQLNNNAQRFYQHPQILQTPRFFSGVQQQHSIRQRQVPSAPVRTAQQQFYTPQQARFTTQNVQTRATVPAPSDKDFLSSLQIIDTQGRLRELRDFGLGGTGNHPEEPELERQLKSIFDTITRDLENAAFLPLDMNGGSQQQLSNIFQYNKDLAQPNRATGQHQHQLHQIKQQSVSEERPRPPQVTAHHSPQQNQKQQFQFLQPARAKVVENPVRSPAQTLREAKKQPDRVQDEQRPIEQAPLINDNQVQLPVKGSPEQAPQQQPIQQQPIQIQPLQQQPIQQLPQQPLEDERIQGSYKSSTPIQREPESKTTLNPQHEIKFQQEPIVQGPIEHRVPVQTVKRPIHQTPIEQQLQQQGFDEEPAALKTVERVQTQTKDSTFHRQRPVDSFKQAFQHNNPLEQPTLIAKPVVQAPIQQQQYAEIQQQQTDRNEGEPLTGKPKSNAKNFDGWVPIVGKQPVQEQQKLEEPQAELPLGQIKEEPGFDVQRPVEQQREPKNEQQKTPLSSTTNLDDGRNIQQEVQYQSSKTHSGISKFRKSINKLAAKTKSSSSSNSGFQNIDAQQQGEQIPFQEQQQQQEDTPIQQQQQEEALAQALEQQRQDIIQQQRTQDSAGARKETGKTEQRREEPTPIITTTSTTTTTTTTTPRPAQRNEQVKGGRKVKLQLADRIKTPVQQAREQQTKVIKEQQQLQQQQLSQSQQFQQQKPIQTNQITVKITDQVSKGPKQSQKAAPQLTRQEQILVDQEEVQGQTNIEEQDTPVLSTIRETPKNKEQRRQQALIEQSRDDLNQEQKSQQQTRVQEDLSQFKEDQFNQQKEDLGQQKVESSSQFEDLNQQKEEIPQQKEDVTQQRVESAQQKVEVVQQQRDETAQEKIEQTQQQTQQQEQVPQQEEQKEDANQQKIETPEQKEEQAQQKEEVNQTTEEVPQKKEDSSSRKEEQSDVRDDLTQQNEDQNQEKEKLLQEQRPDIKSQQQKQEEILQQQQENPVEQISQQPDVTPKQPEINQSQQQVQEENTQTQQAQTVTQQEQNQDDGSSATQQEQQPLPAQNEEKGQDDVQVQQQANQSEEPETVGQGKQRVPEIPQRQVQEESQAEEEPVVTTTPRPPLRPNGIKKVTRIRGKVTEIKQEVDQQTTAPTRPPPKSIQTVRQNVKSNLKKQEQSFQTRGRFFNRQKNDDAPNNEGYLSAHQLLNTYNPLQFEPERISSLANRAIETSSQSTNVNSSGESY